MRIKDTLVIDLPESGVDVAFQVGGTDGYQILADGRVLLPGAGSESSREIVSRSEVETIAAETGGVEGLRKGRVPLEAPDGVNVLFTLPDGEEALAGSLEVFLNGIRYNDDEIVEGGTVFTIVGIPIPVTGDFLRINYIVS